MSALREDIMTELKRVFHFNVSVEDIDLSQHTYDKSPVKLKSIIEYVTKAVIGRVESSQVQLAQNEKILTGNKTGH